MTGPAPQSHRISIAVASVTAVLLALLCVRQFLPVDFSAFACGGAAFRAGADVGSSAALQLCENQVLAPFHGALFRGETVPAPFPPTTLWAFSFLPIAMPTAAFAVWTGLNLCGYGLLIFALRRITALPLRLLIAATVISQILVPIGVGQITPIILGSLGVSAWAVFSGRPTLAGIGVLPTLLEPHLGIPAVLAVCLAEKRARRPLVFAAGAVAALMLGMTRGTIAAPAIWARYLQSTLPLHARAELLHDGQYSLAHILTLFGVRPGFALGAAGAEYLAMLAVGGFIAWRLGRAADARLRALAVFAGPACAVVGGTFVHVQQMSATLPVALVLLSIVRQPPSRMLMLAIVIALALPLEVLHAGIDAVLYGLLAAVMLDAFGGLRPATRVSLAVGVYLLAAAAFAFIGARSQMALAPARFEPILLAAQAHTSNVEDMWMLYCVLHFSWLGAWSLLLQAPIFVGAIGIAVALCRLALDTKPGVRLELTDVVTAA